MPPARFAPLIESYRQSGADAGHPAANLKVSIASHMYIAKNSQDAMTTFYPHYASYFRTPRPIGFPRASSRRSTTNSWRAPRAHCSSAARSRVVDKILYEYRMFRHQRFIAQIDIGGLPYDKVAEVTELFATEVAPVVRRETAG